MTPDLPTVLYDGSIRITTTRSGGLLVATSGCSGNLLLTHSEALELLRALSTLYTAEAADAEPTAEPAGQDTEPAAQRPRRGGARRSI